MKCKCGRKVWAVYRSCPGCARHYTPRAVAGALIERWAKIKREAVEQEQAGIRQHEPFIWAAVQKEQAA